MRKVGLCLGKLGLSQLLVLFCEFNCVLLSCVVAGCVGLSSGVLCSGLLYSVKFW